MNRIQEIMSKMNISNDMGDLSLKNPGKITKPSNKCIYNECDGSGMIHYRREDGTEAMTFCKCREQRQLLNSIKTARIPKEYHHKSLEDFNVNHYQSKDAIKHAKYAQKVASGFIKSFETMNDMGKGLYIYSKTKGTGKTLLSIIIIYELMMKYQINPLYISVVNILSELKNTFHQKEVNSYDIIRSLTEADILVMDDLGVEKTTDWVEEILTQILDERMMDNKPTIITSNMPITELDRKYPSGRIKSRVEKMTFPIPMPEESVRSTLSKQENDKVAKLFFEDE